MATTEKIRRDIEKVREKITEQQKRLRALEAQLAEEENLEIVRMVKAVHMDNKELTAFLRAYASGMISLPEGMMEKADKKRSEYYNYYSYKTWGAAATYHLCIDSSALGIEGTVRFIEEFVVRKLGL